LKLSDSFPDPAELGLVKDGFLSLELTVKVYNINRDHNEAIVRRCKTLEGYSVFIAAVREYEGKGKNRDEAIKLAVKDCIEHNILKDFLETHAAEVLNMLITEWNWDDAFAIQREEGREEGREEDVKRLCKYGMTPEQIAEALELPPDTIYAYLRTE
jgi:DNA-binding NarL/FixJ family response regulator